MSEQLIEIVVLALVALFIAFRLYTVLGRRTGHERSPDEVRVPQPRPEVPAKDVTPLTGLSTAGAGPLARALMDIKLADRNFDEAKFLAGARAAYGMIVTAYAKGERAALRPLVSDDVFASFDSAIRAQEGKGEKTDFTFAGLKSARITDAALKGRTVDVTVTFESDMSGGSDTPHPVTDVWTFARDVGSRDPNWQLVATSAG